MCHFPFGFLAHLWNGVCGFYGVCVCVKPVIASFSSAFFFLLLFSLICTNACCRKPCMYTDCTDYSFELIRFFYMLVGLLVRVTLTVF